MRALILMMSLLLTSLSCSNQVFMAPEAMQSALKKKEFRYIAKSAMPTNYDVIKVMNSMPNAPSTRILNLDPGYGFTLKQQVFKVDLPYFGRTYNLNPNDVNNGGIKFESKDFNVTLSTTKKGNNNITIVTKDQGSNYTFNLEIYKNGSAFLSVSSTDRQPISYDGNIAEIKD